MPAIKVAIVGVGNCASALVQGAHKYGGIVADASGLMRADIGGYTPSDLHFVVGFDVDTRKVGRLIKDAIFQRPNCCWPVSRGVAVDASGRFDGIVHQGPRLDGISDHMAASALDPDIDHKFLPSPADVPADAGYYASVLTQLGVGVLVNYLPVGSQRATEFWAEVCLQARVAMVNCIPVFIASSPQWSARFKAAGVPIIGDDMKSQFGASVLSQMLQELAFTRGHHVVHHIQQNSGGNTDFLNMTNHERLASKKVSKENVIRSQHDIRGLTTADTFIHAGPSDYIRCFGDTKVAHFQLALTGFGGAPVALDAKLTVEDSPNSAGVVIDAIRYVQVAAELGLCGALCGASAFTQKSPPKQMTLHDALVECDALAARHTTAVSVA